MLKTLSRIRAYRPAHFHFAAFTIFLVLCALGGGASRMGTISFIYVRAAAIGCLLFLLLADRRLELGAYRFPLLSLFLLAMWMVIQLIPLPPSIWTALPLRNLIVAPVTLLGDTPWRPLSISPDATINSVLSLLIPLSVLLTYSSLTEGERRKTVPLLLGMAILSAVLGIVQFAGGPESAAYLYERRSVGVPIGIFSNRNHQAVFLAMAILLTGVMYRLLPRHYAGDIKIIVLAGVTSTFLMANVIATGSRTGTGLSLLALIYTIVTVTNGTPMRASRKKFAASLGILTVGGLFMLLLYLGRAVSLDRLLAFDAASEQRFQSMPVMLDMLHLLWPFGSGFGTFDPAYRALEPDLLLHETFFNHAHNDWLELFLTGGIPAALMVAAFSLWVGSRMIHAFRSRPSADALIARAGGLALLLLGLASIVDYPLRTPFLSAVAALASCWLAEPRLLSHRASRT